MSDLKACPACEGDDVETTYPDRGRCHVFCGDCGMRGPSVKTIEEADAAWNKLPRRNDTPTVGPATLAVAKAVAVARAGKRSDRQLIVECGGHRHILSGATADAFLAELEADR